MSTRCQIGFYPTENTPVDNWEALIYKHHDGYPDSDNGIIALIKPYLDDFAKHRGLSDLEYASAFLLWKMQQQLKADDTGQWAMTGFGICKVFHGDIAYYYHVSPACIKVYKVLYGEFEKKDGEIDGKATKLVEKHPFK